MSKRNLSILILPATVIVVLSVWLWPRPSTPEPTIPSQAMVEEPPSAIEPSLDEALPAEFRDFLDPALEDLDAIEGELSDSEEPS